MKTTQYFLETEPRSWSGQRQLHAAGCGLMPEKSQIKPIGRFSQPIEAMKEARRIYRRASSCHHCCKA